MAYYDPAFEQRRNTILGITGQSPSVSPVSPTKTFTDPTFEQRRQQILTAPRPQPKVQPIQQQPITVTPVKKSLIQQLSDVVSTKLNTALLRINPQGGGLKGAKERLKATPAKEYFLPTSSTLAGKGFRKYVSDTVKTAVNAVEGVGKLTPPYITYRAAINKPVTPSEYVSTLVNTPLDTLGTLWRINPAAPVWGAVMGELKITRKKLKEKGTDLGWSDISDIIQGATQGVTEQPGVGEAITDNVKWATAINYVFMATMITKPFVSKKLNTLNLRAEELNRIAKTLSGIGFVLFFILFLFTQLTLEQIQEVLGLLFILQYAKL